MTRKGLVLYCTDVANAVAFLGLLATGATLEWVLPHGEGRGGGGGGHGMGWRSQAREHAGQAEWLGLSRHDWGEVHFWIAIACTVLVLIHLALHFGWIVTSTRRLFSARTPAKPIEPRRFIAPTA